MWSSDQQRWPAPPPHHFFYVNVGLSHMKHDLGRKERKEGYGEPPGSPRDQSMIDGDVGRDDNERWRPSAF